ncbi:MAG: ExbD/TolR family protein [Acidobacteriota bacterium]|jgi:biopolymer transport protein ExbD|uniref:Biopolymer transporter ExbD n=1 Tax=Thermoanaerobaculum aquaticum TaxID=1312852 RepID=A0A062XKE4_9BACT|nr:biopolymer transporter ExbD [Thermoanaerobaculum aquaticum]KDA53002.1 hypothetical protein EG19_08375 [Thermoanaerobaculum aquaticum]GBC79718.1 Biopolymer transport protein ExbD [bacterium HR09]
MAMMTGGDRNGVKSEINVTPLVDVCLVLLIIFMVVTPMLQKGVDVQLPTAQDPAKKPESQNQVLLAMKADKTMWYENHWLPEKDLAARLAELHARAPGKEIVVKADARLTWGDVKRLLKLVKEAGFSNMALVAEKEKRQ